MKCCRRGGGPGSRVPFSASLPLHKCKWSCGATCLRGWTAAIAQRRPAHSSIFPPESLTLKYTHDEAFSVDEPQVRQHVPCPCSVWVLLEQFLEGDCHSSPWRRRHLMTPPFHDAVFERLPAVGGLRAMFGVCGRGLTGCGYVHDKDGCHG